VREWSKYPRFFIGVLWNARPSLLALEARTRHILRRKMLIYEPSLILGNTLNAILLIMS